MRWPLFKKTPKTTRRQTYSLRRRLISTTLGSSIVVGIVSTTIVLVMAWKEVSDTFDDTLEEGARLVLALGEGISAEGLTARGRKHNAEPALRLDYQIIAANGVVVRRGEDAPKRPFVEVGSKDDRFYDVWVGKKRWRVYIRDHDTQRFSVQIGQQWEDRTDLILDMLESLAWPLMGLWLLLGLVNWWVIQRLFAPLDRLAKGMEKKSPSDLTPVAYEGRAQEVRSVVSSLNQLLSRLSQALENERRFTADAAHELRTPLAALMSRVQVMQRRLATMDTPSPALSDDVQRLRQDIGRTTALIESLLQLARLDPESAEMATNENVNVSRLIDDVIELYDAAAQARDMTVTATCETDVMQGNEEGLRTVLRNLLHNAISYGRQGGNVSISLKSEGRTLLLSVRDDGDGVSPEDIERLTWCIREWVRAVDRRKNRCITWWDDAFWYRA
jgi:two-component system sensor histidine kinase QseC